MIEHKHQYKFKGINSKQELNNYPLFFLIPKDLLCLSSKKLDIAASEKISRILQAISKDGFVFIICELSCIKLGVFHLNKNLLEI